MQIELLETFLDLMETASFNRTAERLGVTQSTVSARVQTLEAALGRKLFVRNRAGTRPTPAGHRFLDHARALRHQWTEARRTVQGAENFVQSMRIGMQHDLAAAHIGDWIEQFRKALPATSFYVELDYSNQMSADLLAGELDLAVLFTPRHMPDIHYELVGEVSYRMISSHAGTLDEVEQARYIFTNYSPAFDKAHRQLVARFSSTPVASGQNIAVRGLLESLGGTAFVLEDAANELVNSGAFRFVADVAPIPQAVYFAVHLRHRHSGVHKRLLEIVRARLAPG